MISTTVINFHISWNDPPCEYYNTWECLHRSTVKLLNHQVLTLSRKITRAAKTVPNEQIIQSAHSTRYIPEISPLKNTALAPTQKNRTIPHYFEREPYHSAKLFYFTNNTHPRIYETCSNMSFSKTTLRQPIVMADAQGSLNNLKRQSVTTTSKENQLRKPTETSANDDQQGTPIDNNPQDGTRTTNLLSLHMSRRLKRE